MSQEPPVEFDPEPHAPGPRDTAPHDLGPRPRDPRRILTVPRVVAAALVVLVVLLVVDYVRPLPAAAADATVTGPGGGAPSMPWPSAGQGAVGAVGAGVLRASPTSRPRPIASITKVMTAIVVLDAKPLRRGQSGPTITVTSDDVTAYTKAKAAGQSVVEVQAGETLTELQALEALLIPSGNNIGDLLLRWAYGNVAKGLAQMSAVAARLGMRETTFADSSGFSARTQSTPSDLVILGEAAMQRDVLAAIVALPQVDLPVAGTVYNVNGYLGVDGIVGIKTGNIPEAGACYLFAAAVTSSSGDAVTVVGAVMGLPTLDLAFRAGDALVAAAAKKLTVRTIASAGQVVGSYRAPWGASAGVAAQQELDVPVWPGAPVSARLDPGTLPAPHAQGDRVGSLVVDVGRPGHATEHRVPIVLKAPLDEPGPLWRLVRIGAG